MCWYWVIYFKQQKNGDDFSQETYLTNVVNAVIHGFVPVWIDGVMCLCVGVYELYVVHTEGGRVHLQPRPPEISFVNFI